MLKLRGSWQIAEHALTLSLNDFPDQELFLSVAENMLHDIGIKRLNVDYGADRAQIGFEFQAQKYILCFDGTCEAIWIESLGNVDPETRLQLLARLNKLNE